MYAFFLATFTNVLVSFPQYILTLARRRTTPADGAQASGSTCAGRKTRTQDTDLMKRHITIPALSALLLAAPAVRATAPVNVTAEAGEPTSTTMIVGEQLPDGASPFRTDAPLYTVTMTGIPSTAADNKDDTKVTCLQLISADGQVLSVLTPKNNTTTFQAPAGTYYGLGMFTTSYGTTKGMKKFIATDPIQLTSDTTITLSGNTGTHYVGLNHLLPDGSPLKVGEGTSAAKADFSNANVFKITYLGAVYRRNSRAVTSTFFNVPFTNVGKTQERIADVLVNDKVDNDYCVYSVAFAQPLDSARKTSDLTIPSYASYMARPLGAKDTTYLADASTYKLFTPPAYRPSPADTKPANTMDYVFMYLLDDNRNGGTIIYSATQNKERSIYLNARPTEFGKLTMRCAYLETTGTTPMSVADGTGISLPRRKVDADGSVVPFISDNIGEGYLDMALGSDKLGIFNPHPFYSKGMEQGPYLYGNGAPILTFPLLFNKSAGAKYTYPFTMMTTPGWIGAGGEIRDIDRLFMTPLYIAGADTLATAWNSINSAASKFAATEHEPRQMRFMFDNTNFRLDSVQGRSLVEVSYQEDSIAPAIPCLQMYQMRNGAGDIANHFAKFADAQLYFSAADITRLFNADIDYARLSGVKVEVSPNGKDEFAEVPVTENPDYFAPVCLGWFYSATLRPGRALSANGYYDLRFTLTNDRGARTVQTLTPAFYVADCGIQGAIDRACGLSYDGSLVSLSDGSSATFCVYRMDGAQVLSAVGTSVSVSGLPAGIYLVRAVCADGTARSTKLMKK